MIFSAEWTYLLTTRKVGGEDSVFSCVRLKYGSNATDTVSGVIIYPDDFSFSEAGVASMPFGARKPITQINAADWATLEEAGCVFLPSMHVMSFDGSTISLDERNTGIYVHIWSATANNAAQAPRVFYELMTPRHQVANLERNRAINVRLAQDL